MKNSMKAITALVIDSATLTGGYDPFAAAGLTEACSLIRFVNDSNVDVGISYDGITTHDILGAGGLIENNLQANSRPNNKAAQLAKGSNVCLIGNAGVGDIYLIGYYQE